jgi:hypothetical protein
MSKLLARVSACLYKSTLFHTNSLSAVAYASSPFTGRPCAQNTEKLDLARVTPSLMPDTESEWIAFSLVPMGFAEGM